MNNYTILHLHSDLSNGVTNIDSITKYKSYIEKAKECGMTALAFSEHGCIFEWLHKKSAIEDVGMKYIHAEEFYVTESLSEKIRDNYHLLLIAKNYEGFKELNKLSSISFNRDDGHFYFVPRISYDELKATSDNIIVSTACLGGILSKGNRDLKNDFFKWMMRHKDRCFLEIAQHIAPQQIEYNQMLYKLHETYGLNLVVGTDTHALDLEHSNGRSLLQKSKKIYFENEDFFDLTFKTYDELVECFEKQGSLPKEIYLEAIENTNVIANMVEPFEITNEKKYPHLYDDSETVMNKKIKEGIEWRGINKKDNFQEYKERIQYEMKAFKHNEAIDFMLLEEMYKHAMRDKGIGYGYSRGSCSGSLVAYLLGITHVDPIEWNLNFDRFMNVERVSLADVDTDWFDTDRENVRDFLYNYKGLHCSEIITFNTIALKGAFKDVARAFDMSPDQANDITKDIENEDKQIYYRKKYADIFEYVDLLQGVIVSVGTHPSACIVSPITLNDNIGLMTTKNCAHPVSQLNMKEIDSLNYVKLDILGLDAVGLINQTCDLIGIDRLLPENIDFNDEKVWKSIVDDTIGIFQWESKSASDYLKQLFSDTTIENIKKVNPNVSYIDLLSVGNGAIRPAGESYRYELAKGIYNDNGHPALNDMLKSSLGYLVYQEQIIEFLHRFCGYTMGEADVVRRGFAKKTGTEKFIPKIKEGFIKTMESDYGVSQEKSEKLIIQFLQVIEDASSYLFSNNHSTPYSMIGYAIGWLRYYYPLEFLTVASNIYQTDDEKSKRLTEYIYKVGIKIYPPKFRKSKGEFMMDKENNAIYKGVGSIKGLNNDIANKLYDLKECNFESFYEFIIMSKEIGLKKDQLDSLIKIGYFDEFGTINYLLSYVKIFNKYGECKIIKKAQSIDIDLEGCYAKETAKQYGGIDNIKLINKIMDKCHKETPISDKIKYQIQILGYTDIIDESASIHEYAVQSIENDRYGRVWINLYNLKLGISKTLEMNRRKYTGLEKGDIVRAIFKDKAIKKYKGKDKKGKNIYVDTGETRRWIYDYKRIKE
jgi:DNA polymerase-3 subunit alpha